MHRLPLLVSLPSPFVIIAIFLFRFPYSVPYLAFHILDHADRWILILSSSDPLLGMATYLVYNCVVG
jgi:hypothetical protein